MFLALPLIAKKAASGSRRVANHENGTGSKRTSEGDQGKENTTKEGDLRTRQKIEEKKRRPAKPPVGNS
jgi:hypothetical protein